MTGIIGALEKEIESLVQRCERVTDETVGGITFFEGTLEGERVAICHCGVGKVAAAYAATLMFTRFSPELIINTGVAGGTVARGETVISERLVQHDVLSAADGLPRGQVDGFDSPYFYTDPDIVASLKRAADTLGVKSHVGTVVSGDQFICDSAAVRALKAQFGAMAVDMESAAIAQVCAMAGVRFCALRTVTDNADESAVADFYELVEKAAETSCAVLTEYLKKKE